MAKRNPKKPSSSNQSEEQAKRLSAFKTALPLVVTFLLLGVLYMVVLRPQSPANTLKSAVLNSFNSEKQKSYRFDGSFGDTNRGIAGEYAGQKSSNGDQDFRIRLKNDSANTSLETATVSGTNYLRIDGVENLNGILSKITGVKTPDDATTSVLQSLQGKWIMLSPATEMVAQKVIPCVDLLPGFREQSSAPKLTEENYPFEYKSGPYSPKDDSEDEIYDAVLKTDRTVTAPEDAVVSVVNCLEKQYGKDDFRLRDYSKTDEQTMKFTITVDPLSNTVKKLVAKQVGMYYQLVMRDYNKDVTVPVPENAQTVAQIYLGMAPAQQTQLVQNTGIDISSVLQ